MNICGVAAVTGRTLRSGYRAYGGIGAVATKVKSLNHRGHRGTTEEHGENLSGLMPTTAVQHVKRMRGGAQSHLMRCDDGHYYVVKFRNNPQHERVLANEFLATRLAERVGLPVPAAER